MRPIVVVLLCLQVTYTVQDPLKVSIYYESLCPDSIRFIANQLHPAFVKIPEKLNLDFVPYGKATHEFVDGKWQFECQHGYRECYGNIMAACALSALTDPTKRESFVYCIMASGNPASDTNLESCVVQEGLAWSAVQTCGTSSTGDELLVAYGEQTHNVDPLITFIPTIIFNDVYNNTLQQNALADFLFTACDLLEEKPAVCPTTMRRNSARRGFRNWLYY